MLRASFALVMATLILSACGQQKPPQMPPPQVGVVTVVEQAVPLSTSLPGRTSPFAVSDVRPQVSGLIKARLFTEGSVVKAGQALYQIDPAPYQAAYDNAMATLTSTKAKADRYTALKAQNAIAGQDYDDAQAAYLQAKANAESARINLNYTRVTAPIGGRIGASTVTPGALVTASQATALATISTLDPIYVDIDQSSSELLQLERAAQKGAVERGSLSARVLLTLDDGTPYGQEGKLQFTDVTVDQSTGTVQLRAIFPNPDGLLLPGLYVRATVAEGIDVHGILLPQQAVSHDAKGDPTVLVVDAKNVARLRLIKTGSAVGSNWQVTDGLKPGEKVIVEGQQKVMPDMPVSPQPISATPSKP